MRSFIGRAVSILVVAGGWALFGVKTVLDLIGYSTAPEDVEVARARLDQFLGWVLSIPWWGTLGFALAATLWLMWVSWPRQTTPPKTTGLTSGQGQSPDKYILTNLVRFFNTGNQITTQLVRTDAELMLWELMRQNWHNEVNSFVYDRISELDGNKLRYIYVKNPVKFNIKYNDKHNISLNIMQECLNYIETLAERYSDKRMA